MSWSQILLTEQSRGLVGEEEEEVGETPVAILKGTSEIFEGCLCSVSTFA